MNATIIFGEVMHEIIMITIIIIAITTGGKDFDLFFWSCPVRVSVLTHNIRGLSLFIQANSRISLVDTP
jgi:hypothetical protein